jgi:formiminotetrahydrofolate cyclodeaminase
MIEKNNNNTDAKLASSNETPDEIVERLCKARERFNALYEKRDEALEEVMMAWLKARQAGDEATDDAEEELNLAVDALALAHIAMTFEIHH